MNKIPNRQAICETLMKHAAANPNIVVLCSDSRGSASLGAFAERFPNQFVELGIAEQNLVSVAAGMANMGYRPFVASPACFLSSRSLEQAKVDVAYSATNVKLVGISGGISYGALGMTHHSAQDIAAMSSLPGMRVYLPSDRFLTKALMEHLVLDEKPAYLRVGRNAVPDIYSEDGLVFEMDKAVCLHKGNHATIIACGEMVSPALEAAHTLAHKGILCRVLDMYCVKPLDREAVTRACKETPAVLTTEEHSPYGGLGSMVSRIAAELGNTKVRSLCLPDSTVIAGKSAEVFRHYGMDAAGMARAVEEML